MRRTLFLLFFVVISSEIRSQELFVSAERHYTQSLVFKTTLNSPKFDNVVLPPGFKMRRVGSTLTVAGAALFLGGIIVISGADKTSYYNSSTGLYDYDPQLGLGALMITGGVGMMVPGIIFWTKGAKKYNRYLENLEGSVTTNGTGLAINIKF